MHVRHAGHLQHVRHVPAAAALDVEGVDGAAVQRREGVLDRQALVQPVAVQRDLDVVLLGHRSAVSSGAGVRAHVLVHLEPARAALAAPRPAAPGRDDEPRPRKPMLTGQASKALNACAAPSGELTPDAPERAELLADDRGHAAGQRGLHDARRQQVDVGVDGAGGGDQALAGDDRRAGADDDVDAVEGVGVAGPADRVDPALADADVETRMPATASMTSTLLMTTSQVSASGPRAGRCRRARSCRTR